MRISALAIAFFTAAAGLSALPQTALALDVSTACSTPQALSQALKDEGQVLIILGNEIIHKEGSPEVDDYAMRAVYLNPETGQGYIVGGNVPFDPTGATSRPITCATVQLKFENARIYNQVSKNVDDTALIHGDRNAALAICDRQSVSQGQICGFHNDVVNGFVHGGSGLMFQGTVTASGTGTGSITTAPVGTIASLFGKRDGRIGSLTYTAPTGVSTFGGVYEFVGYTEKGTALLGKRPAAVASLN